MYNIVRASEVDDFVAKYPDYDSKQGMRYSDGTVRVELTLKEMEQNPLPESPEEWEQKRQQYLRDGHTHGKAGREGESFGYLGDDDYLLYGLAAFYDEEDEHIQESFEYYDWHDWRDDFPDYEMDFEDDPIFFLERFFRARERSYDSILVNLKNLGFCAKHHYRDLLEDERRDLINHSFGIYHAGGYEESKNGNIFVADKTKALVYVEEHLFRGMMYPNVALELLRKMRCVKRADYAELDSFQRRDFLKEIFISEFERILQEEAVPQELQTSPFVSSVLETFSGTLINPETQRSYGVALRSKRN